MLTHTHISTRCRGAGRACLVFAIASCLLACSLVACNTSNLGFIIVDQPCTDKAAQVYQSGGCTLRQQCTYVQVLGAQYVPRTYRCDFHC